MKNFRKTIAAAVVALTFAGAQSALAFPVYASEAPQSVQTSDNYIIVPPFKNTIGAQTSDNYIIVPPFKNTIDA